MKAKSSLSKYILAYDTDCGPCTRFAHVVDSLDKSEIIDFISLTLADQKGLLDRISPPLRYKSFHLIFPNGEVKSGSEALVELIAILPGGKVVSPIVNYFPGGKPFVSLFMIVFQDDMIWVHVILTTMLKDINYFRSIYRMVPALQLSHYSIHTL